MSQNELCISKGYLQLKLHLCSVSASADMRFYFYTHTLYSFIFQAFSPSN